MDSVWYHKKEKGWLTYATKGNEVFKMGTSKYCICSKSKKDIWYGKTFTAQKEKEEKKEKNNVEKNF